MLLRSFIPEYSFKEVYSATPEFLRSLGVKAVVFDIDNTIAPYEIATPTERMKNYIFSLRDAGIDMAFVSNNKGDRVELFNRALGLYNVCDAKKPFSKGVKQCIEHFGLENEKASVIAIGDQIYTDCLAAHGAGIRFIMVKPIQPRENWFFRFKRYCEKPFTRKLEWK